MKKVLIICLFAAAMSMAQRQRVVVLPAIADPETKFSARELDVLTDKLRGYATDILPLGDFVLLKQDYVKEKLGDEALFKACKEGTCVGELIAMVQANFGARCEVFSVNGKLWLKFELYGTLRGENEAGTISTFNEEVEDLKAMEAAIKERVPDAFRKILLPSPAATPPEPPPEPPPAPVPATVFVPASVFVPPEPATVPEFVPSAAVEGEEGESGEEAKKSKWSLGIRGGINFSHLYAEGSDYNGRIFSYSYKSTPGFQLGMVFDWALIDWFHIQPGVMYIQKGAEDDYGVITLQYIEFPLLLSLKFSVLRISAGPYFGICVKDNSDYLNDNEIDIGINAGLGFDIGMFYIGVFYDYGFVDLRDYGVSNFPIYNRTFGFNFGVNL